VVGPDVRKLAAMLNERRDQVADRIIAAGPGMFIVAYAGLIGVVDRWPQKTQKVTKEILFVRFCGHSKSTRPNTGVSSCALQPRPPINLQ